MQETSKHDAINELGQALIKERRSERRWKTIRSLLWLVFFTYLISNLFSYIHNKSPKIVSSSDKRYAALIRIDGMIGPDRNFSAEELIPALKEAFSDEGASGIILDINSPGGTPVQSAIIHDAILSLKKKYKKKIIVVGEDMLTSGAYFVAVAADKIYVNQNTLTGSIGVVMKGFGFVDAIKKFGIERRVYTAGSNKDRLDPFLPQKPEDIKKIKQVMDEVHRNFVQAVLAGRKGKLKTNTENLFSGDFWSGQTALKLGLVDGIGNLLDVSEKEFKTTQYKVYGNQIGLVKFFRDQMNSALDMMFSSN